MESESVLRRRLHELQHKKSSDEFNSIFDNAIINLDIMDDTIKMLIEGNNKQLELIDKLNKLNKKQ